MITKTNGNNQLVESQLHSIVKNLVWYEPEVRQVPF